MTRRSYSIPRNALTLACGAAAPALGGCAPSILGEWELTDIDGYELEYSYSYDGCSYTIRRGFTLELEEKDGDKVTGEAEFSFQYTATGGSCDGPASYSERYEYDLEAELGSDKVWEIEIEEVDTTLECTLEDDTLDCEDDTGLDLTFERA